MGMAHTMICFKGNGVPKFTQGGLETYKGVAPSDLTAMCMRSPREELDFPGNITEFSSCRNLPVYSWLTGEPGYSVYPNGGWHHVQAVKRKTLEFLKWVDSYSHKPGAIMQRDPVFGDAATARATEVFTEEHMIQQDGDTYAFAFMPFDFLHRFNYDQVAQVNNGMKYDDTIHQEWPYSSKPHPDGATYREVFNAYCKDYFIFLEKAKAFGWDAMLIAAG